MWLTEVPGSIIIGFSGFRRCSAVHSILMASSRGGHLSTTSSKLLDKIGNTFVWICRSIISLIFEWPIDVVHKFGKKNLISRCAALQHRLTWIASSSANISRSSSIAFSLETQAAIQVFSLLGPDEAITPDEDSSKSSANEWNSNTSSRLITKYLHCTVWNSA